MTQIVIWQCDDHCHVIFSPLYHQIDADDYQSQQMTLVIGIQMVVMKLKRCQHLKYPQMMVSMHRCSIWFFTFFYTWFAALGRLWGLWRPGQKWFAVFDWFQLSIGNQEEAVPSNNDSFSAIRVIVVRLSFMISDYDFWRVWLWSYNDSSAILDHIFGPVWWSLIMR